MKICLLCHIEKDESEYYVTYDHRRKVHYLVARCKKCLYEKSKETKNINKDIKNKNRNIRLKTRREKDKKFCLEQNIRCKIYRMLSEMGLKKWDTWSNMVGFNVKELYQYLENKFTKKMSWANYGIYWELDHIIPKIYYKMMSKNNDAKKMFIECWKINNLQPLPIFINRYIKRDKIKIVE